MGRKHGKVLRVVGLVVLTKVEAIAAFLKSMQLHN